MLGKRYVVLRDFFRHHGWIADLYNNYTYYVGMMADMVDGEVKGPTVGFKECIEGLQTHEYDIVKDGVVICSVPAMTKEGCFVIDGYEKVVLIQELRLNAELCTFSSSGAKAGTVCEIFAEGATVPARVKVAGDSIIELDTSMIKKDIRDKTSIAVYDVIGALFLSGVNSPIVYQRISYMVRSYIGIRKDSEKLANMCMVYIVASTRGAGGLLTQDGMAIKLKIFGGMDDSLIIATLVVMAVSCLMTERGYLQVSDRDDYSLKRLKTPGETIHGIFKYCVLNCKKPSNFKAMVNRNIHNLIKRGEITIGGRNYNKMSMQLSKRSYIDALSSVRKVVIPCDENTPNIKMRQIHNSQKGYICPCETPEGKSVGITKSLASCCLISTKTDISVWVSYACTNDIFPGGIWTMVDGAVAGWCKADDVKQVKELFPTVSVSMETSNIVRIRTSSGRPLRPLLIVKDRPISWKKISGSFERMLSCGQLEYLDPAECAKSTIASTGYEGNWTRFTHMEIHPCTMLGFAASVVPFPEHNQSARNVFSSAMVKQAMQMYGSEKTCNYPQKPLVYTAISRYMGCDDNPNGINVLTCIMSINGFNQEDAIIVKRSSAERGLFSSVVRGSTFAIVDYPWEIVGERKIPLKVLHGGNEKTLLEMRSMMSPNTAITDIKNSVTENGRVRIDVFVEEYRDLKLGDKLASRHAQKGVVGMLMNEEDMPFTSQGITPDIIINPHAIPSRMTVGQLLEGILGKSAAISGTFEDGTPFIRSNMKSLKDMLKMSDTETVTLGTTGEQVETPVAMGMVYYLALKHQATDKVYVRSTGPKSIMSRQPLSGRSKGGGLRLGEMEYDCMIAHGASKLVTEIAENSDMVEAPYCNKCKVVTDVFETPCRRCGLKTVRVKVPFSYVVFKDLMLSANIQIHTDI